MDKHKNIKRPQHGASLDGIVTGNRRLGVPVNNYYQPNREKATPSLGNFIKRPDGFHSTTNSPIAADRAEKQEAAMLDEPIVLDDIEAKKRKLRFWQRHSKLKRRIKRSLITLMALVLIGAGYFGVKFYITQKHLFRGGGKAPALSENIDINQLKGEGDGRINILLLGIGGPGHDGPDLTDTIMIASIDPINHKTALLSIPRDLWVKIPGDGYQKINAAYVYGKEGSKSKNLAAQEQAGINLLDQTLENVIGIPIHYHAVVDFAAFKQLVDAVGGVTVNVPSTLYDPTIAWENHGNSYIAYKGVQTFNGQKALLYARSRETSSDFERGMRQRLIMVALKDKIFSVGTFSNPVKVSNLMSGLGNNIYTDFSVSDIMRMQKIMSQIPSANIISLDLVTPPHALVTTGNMNGLSIVEPRAGLFDYSDIQSYVRNALKDSFIAKENANIAIYNATDVAGLATSKATYLKSYGYNVTTIGNTPNTTNPATTTIVDLTKGVDKYTKHYLEERFGVSAVKSVPASVGINPPAGTSFVIILGQDASSTSQN